VMLDIGLRAGAIAAKDTHHGKLDIGRHPCYWRP